jgi:hypothetical protein
MKRWEILRSHSDPIVNVITGIHMHALVLSGRYLPGHNPADAIARAASVLGLSADDFSTRVVSAMPVAVREISDFDAVRALQSQLMECGMDADVVQSDGIQWYLQNADSTRGPVPLAYLEAEVRAGRLDGRAPVRRTTNPAWIPVASVVSSGPSDAVAQPAHNAPLPDMLEAARLFIGPSHAYYLRSWGLDGTGGHAWNWPGLVFGPAWLLYRKMYGYAFVCFALIFVEGLMETQVEVSILFSYAISVAFNVAIACVGNALYRKHFERAIRTLSPGRDPVSLRIELAVCAHQCQRRHAGREHRSRLTRKSRVLRSNLSIRILRTPRGAAVRIPAAPVLDQGRQPVPTTRGSCRR